MQVAALITYLTGEVYLLWRDQNQQDFDEVKELIASNSVHNHQDFEKPFILKTDASKFSTGAVILKLSNDELEHPSH